MYQNPEHSGSIVSNTWCRVYIISTICPAPPGISRKRLRHLTKPFQEDSGAPTCLAQILPRAVRNGRLFLIGGRTPMMVNTCCFESRFRDSDLMQPPYTRFPEACPSENLVPRPQQSVVPGLRPGELCTSSLVGPLFRTCARSQSELSSLKRSFTGFILAECTFHGQISVMWDPYTYRATRLYTRSFDRSP